MSKSIEYWQLPMAESGIEVKSADDGKSRRISGYAAVFNTYSEPWFDGTREKITPGAFTKTLQQSKKIKALWNHEDSIPLGSTENGTLVLTQDDRGLHFELDLPDNTAGEDALIWIQRKDVDQVSFGAYVIQEQFTQEGDTRVRLLKEFQLLEISPVTFPMFPATTVEARKYTPQGFGGVFDKIEDMRNTLAGLTDRFDRLEKNLGIEEQGGTVAGATFPADNVASPTESQLARIESAIRAAEEEVASG